MTKMIIIKTECVEGGKMTDTTFEVDGFNRMEVLGLLSYYFHNITSETISIEREQCEIDNQNNKES